MSDERPPVGPPELAGILCRDIPKGTKITQEMLTILGPGTGLKPKCATAVVGRTAGVDIAEHERITWEKLA